MKMITQGILIATIALLGCGQSDTSSESAAKTTGLDVFWSAEQPVNPTAVGEMKKTAKNDSEIVVEGRVREFVSGYAAIRLIDMGLEYCGEQCESECPTPWDYCCIPQDEQTPNIITVEFHEDERPIKGTVEGFHGIDHLSHLVVKGKVKRDDAGNVMLIASRVHKK